MKHIIESYQEKLYESVIWNQYFPGMNVGALDIETTGLDPSKTRFILGCLYNCQTHELHQVLAENRQEECETLCEYLEEIAKVDVVITYNGRKFDMPFLAKRLEVLTKGGKIKDSRFRDILDRVYDLDLFVVVRGHSPIKSMVPNLRQKTIENYMGLWETRTDEISGADSVELYYRYEKTGDKEAEQKILLHNNDDVRQLTKLTRVLSKCDIHKAMYNMGFPAGRNLVTGKPSVKRNQLIIQGVQKPAAGGYIDYVGYALGSYPVETEFSSATREFRFSVPVIRDSGLTLIDLNAAGVHAEELERFPSCESGFLIIEDAKGPKHMEINHFTKAFIRKFQEEEL
ncbi:MAG: ribonuclease H-like domain-containing protein [Bacillota bacterium]|nr:ribonuclease H-like domain-containing protein [Bacillota bacterium]